MSRENWTSEKIFNRLLNNKTKKTYWKNILELRKRPNIDVYTKAYELAKSIDNYHKGIGLDVLQQLGFNPRFNKEETLALHFKLLELIQSNEVLKTIFYGIGHNNDELSDKEVSKLVMFKNVESTNVKHALITALSGIENDNAVDVLIQFSEDKIASIRDWATFSLGTQIDKDDEKIRMALWNRVNDVDFDTKSEAIVGLVNRKDKRVKEVIISELVKDNYGTLLFEAILKMNDVDFLPFLYENLKSARSSEDNTIRGWVLALEGTIETLEKIR